MLPFFWIYFCYLTFSLTAEPTKLDQFIDQRMERRAGLPIRLPCLAEHDSDLNIHYVWTINGKKLDQIEAESGHFRVLEDNTLEVERPTQEDSGVYTCVASTKLDSTSKSVTVVIEDVPPPVKSARILECNQTDPLVTITFDHLEPEDRTKPVEEFWLRYSVDQGKWHVYPVPVKTFQHEVIGDDSLRQVNGRLSIMLKPFGMYAFQLIARNAIGDSAAYNIDGVCQTAQKAPSRNPSGVRVDSTHPHNLIVYWDAMARDEWNGEKFAYKISYRRKDENGPWKELVVVDPFADKFTIDLGRNGTRPGDPYEVQVQAMNGKGLSTSPEVVEGRTSFTRYKVSVEGIHWLGPPFNVSDFDQITVIGRLLITKPRRPELYWVIPVLLLLLLCAVTAFCVIYRRRKNPVAETERLHGQEPMLPKERHFEEFGKGEGTNRSLVGPGSKNAGLASTNPLQLIAESTPQQ
uniref:Uncharacterized protein n=1 Tax=Globodera rostochiensis TaxID=31243 RepID=A0A914H7F1_GLORO